MMKIGIDVMGGDHAPDKTVHGAILAYDQLPSDVKLVLIGDKEKILTILSQHKFDSSKFEIVHSTEVIEMGEHPAKTYSKKTNSSINIGFNLLSTGKIDGFASAGNTGAVLVGTMYSVKSIPGIIRPCITGPLPLLNGGVTTILDVGINPDCRPDVLYQYAILGSIYAQHVHKIQKPKIGLLNIGSEEEKGNLLTKSTHELMKDSKDFNFIGNVEGNNIFEGKADVVICDGFTGNVVLKLSESFYGVAEKRKLNDEYFKRFNYDLYGGTPVLGINSTVVIGHGSSNEKAIKTMILHTKEVIEAELSKKIKEFFK